MRRRAMLRGRVFVGATAVGVTKAGVHKNARSMIRSPSEPANSEYIPIPYEKATPSDGGNGILLAV
jgi:hypothetical protein